jgi:hypothetical protein
VAALIEFSILMSSTLLYGVAYAVPVGDFLRSFRPCFPPLHLILQFLVVNAV